ncbi:hypothetical protein BT63DRAFT_424667 [Microthyrium microscopicum]|uniref:Fungal N-terminal domain-containing protein n=1 Tax=Microthyrium microscopicum TaxID=703497 RepID=A0A6A6UC60_9PEZI|nr:hypothetical protein BT63DRAFT_424667 [Microthyrium microscopicum]
MVDPISVASGLMTVLSIIRKTIKLVEDLSSAPSEFTTTKQHLHSLSIVFESVKTDLINNNRSIINRPNNLRSAKRNELIRLVSTCDKSIQRIEKILKQYRTVGHSLWKAWRWSDKGRQEVASVEADLMFNTTVLNVYLSKEGLETMWKMEISIEAIKTLLEKIIAGSAGGYNTKTATPSGRRSPKKKAKHGSLPSAVLASLFISRLKAKVKEHRKLSFRPSKTSSVPKPLKRVRTIPVPSKRKSTLLSQYSERLKNDQARLGTFQYECYIVSGGQYAFGGPSIYPKARQIGRGQTQLAELVKVFEAAGAVDASSIDKGHRAAKDLVKSRNYGSKSRRKWEFAAGRIESISSSPHGTVRTRKVMIVIKRPKA